MDVEETFGPFAVVHAEKSFDEWCERVNASKMRFQACVFTTKLEQGLRAAKRLRYGAVFVNEPTSFRLEPMPFGGRGLSGTGREGPRYALEAFTEPKAVVLRP